MNRDTINIIASQRLVETLSKINHVISHSLLEQIRYRGRATISYLDFGESNDSISFIYSNKVYELQREFDYKYTEKVWKDKRSEMKIGKVIRLIFGDRYPINNPKGNRLPKPPVDIETFVNMYKAEREKNENYDRFSIVNGEEIIYWYNYKNYTRFVHEDTPLGKSCLRYEESSKFLEMYLKNNDKISMLILKDDQGKLRGRAIVWNLDTPEGRTYMDRIYTVNDFDVELFKDYARKNGWLYKERQTFGWNNIIVDGRDESVHRPKDIRLQVQLTNKKLKYYPYLDTLAVYNKKTGILNNDGQLLREEGHIHLVDYQGSYVDEVDHREYVYSNFYGDDILRDEAVFCQIDDDWAYESDTVYVHNTGELRALRGSEKIVCSKVLKTKYFLKEDAVYSDYLKTWIYKDSVKEAFIDPEKTQKVIIHFKLIGKTFIKDSNGDIIKGEPKKEVKPIKKNGILKDRNKSEIDNIFSTYDPYFGGVSHNNDDDHRCYNEEDGDGSDSPLPRTRRRRPLLNNDHTQQARPILNNDISLSNVQARAVLNNDIRVGEQGIFDIQDNRDNIRILPTIHPVDRNNDNIILHPSQRDIEDYIQQMGRTSRIISNARNLDQIESLLFSEPNQPTNNESNQPSSGETNSPTIETNVWNNNGYTVFDIEQSYGINNYYSINPLLDSPSETEDNNPTTDESI